MCTLHQYGLAYRYCYGRRLRSMQSLVYNMKEALQWQGIRWFLILMETANIKFLNVPSGFMLFIFKAPCCLKGLFAGFLWLFWTKPVKSWWHSKQHAWIVFCGHSAWIFPLHPQQKDLWTPSVKPHSNLWYTLWLFSSYGVEMMWGNLNALAFAWDGSSRWPSMSSIMLNLSKWSSFRLTWQTLGVPLKRSNLFPIEFLGFLMIMEWQNHLFDHTFIP